MLKRNLQETRFLADNDSFGADLENATALKLVPAA